MATLVHLGLLEELFANISVVGECCDIASVLHLISKLTKYEDLRYAMRIRELRITDIVLDCMEQQPCDAEVSKFGCAALRNLLMDAEERAIFLRRNGLERVLIAMKWCQSTSAVQEHACHLIFVIAKSSRKRRKMVATQCLDAVCTAAKMHPTHSGVQHRANAALRCLTKDEDPGSQGLLLLALCSATIAALSALAAAVWYGILL
eukprot:CAMPEP_0172161722 /NCGR_PEP_ID=MMETSP1050-20130122/6278_1 /TAXON_ID=233186 /ORGANISM="Cryptomonas curvata, Strain CCAP979/52" /LENGTH=204 /DNA_ID=CAMNT_0012831641 /DNA_START=272 /DNA_END=886 /DNA_ORIENTATION=+